MKDDVFAIYQGKEYTSGIDRNGKVILRSTDIEDIDKGFEKCEPFKYRKEEKLVVCRKIQKSKTPEVIAEELEEDFEQVKQIYDIADGFAHLC